MKKKLLRILVIISIIVCAALPLVGCNRNPLDPPTNLRVDDAVSVLSWDSVKGARGYKIEIKGSNGFSKEDRVRKVSYGIGYLDDEVTYTFRVSAEGNKVDFSDSDWSEEITVFKPFENGLSYRAINSNSEYEVSSVGTATRHGNVIEIPSVYRGKPVTRIGTSAFYINSRITEVIIPDSVTEIGARAFQNCVALTKIDIPDSVVAIGEKAFYGCSALKTVKLSKNITTLPLGVFYSCKSLNSVDFGEDSSIAYIGDDAFWQCESLGTTTDNEGTVTANHTVALPDSVLQIGNSAFASCKNLTIFDLGDGIQYVGPNAFHNCASLNSISFGNNLLEIGGSAFSGCESLTDVRLPESVTTIGDKVFEGCTTLENLELGENIVSIGRDLVVGTVIWENATVTAQDEVAPIYIDGWLLDTKFPTIDLEERSNVGPRVFNIQDGTVGVAAHALHCTVVDDPESDVATAVFGSAIDELYIPESVVTIGDAAFVDSINLTKVVIGNETNGSKAKTIGAQAFNNCILLNEFIIYGNSLESIGNEAFRNCYVLGASSSNQADTSIVQQIKLPESLRSIGTNAFINTHFYSHYAGGVVYVGGWVIDFDSTTNKATVEASVTSTLADKTVEEIPTIGIANYAFYNLEELTSVTLPDTIKYFGKAAFQKCVALTSIRIPAGVTEISDYAFYGCTALASIDLSNVTSIGRSAFYNAGSGAPTVDENGNSIGGVLTVTNTEQLVSIGDYAFYNCPYLTNFTFGEDLKKLGAYSFAGTGLRTVRIPDDSITQIGDYTFTTCVNLERVILGEGITSIGRYAFNKNMSLEEISLPSTLVSIGDYAFKEDSALAEIKLTEGLESIGKSAFVNCSSLNNINLPSTLTYIGNMAFRGCTGFTSIILSKEIDTISMHVFYGAKVTFYTDASAIPEGWHVRWNSSSRPVFLGCTLSEDGQYVVSFTKTFDKNGSTLTNIFSYNKEDSVIETDDEGNQTTVTKIKDPIMSPLREGYIFVGWATAPNSATVEYATEYLYEDEIVSGTVLYAVWEPEESEEDAETPDDETSGDGSEDDEDSGDSDGSEDGEDSDDADGSEDGEDSDDADGSEDGEDSDDADGSEDNE